MVIDDIYNYPLLDTTKVALGQILRRNTQASEIVDYVIELRKTGNLCRIAEDTGEHKDPTIICSMGIRKENE